MAACAHCAEPIDGRGPRARYCSPRCARNAEYHRNADRERLAARTRRRRLLGWTGSRLASRARSYGVGRPARAPLPPLVDEPSGHPIYVEARASLSGAERHELRGIFDAYARDLMQEYVLAVLEGREPGPALAEVRRRIARDRAVLVYGLERTDGLVR